MEQMQNYTQCRRKRIKKINKKYEIEKKGDWEGEMADKTQYERDKDSLGGSKGSRRKYHCSEGENKSLQLSQWAPFSFYCDTSRPNSLKQFCSKQFELTTMAISVNNISAV